jgi:hypothetical protein
MMRTFIYNNATHSLVGAVCRDLLERMSFDVNVTTAMVNLLHDCERILMVGCLSWMVGKVFNPRDEMRGVTVRICA